VKLTKLLLLNGKPLSLHSDDVFLRLMAPSRALFTVAQKEQPARGLIQFAQNYDNKALVPSFSGIVNDVSKLSDNLWLLTCVDFLSAFSQRIGVSLRHCTLNDVIDNVAEQSKAPFVVADAGYSLRMVPKFQFAGTGFQLFSTLGHVFNIDKPLVTQLASADIYVGCWNDSPFFNAGLDIDPKYFKPGNVNTSAKIMVLPKLRPGYFFNGNYLTQVRSKDTSMFLTWHKNPWKAQTGASWT